MNFKYIYDIIKHYDILKKLPCPVKYNIIEKKKIYEKIKIRKNKLYETLG
jgi:hypothetical protein